MPQLYEYLGIIIFFWSNEHEPIHVHGEYQGKEIRADIIVKNGHVVNIKIKNIKGRRPFDKSERKMFKTFVLAHAKDIVQKWIDYFVLHKHIQCERITQKEE